MSESSDLRIGQVAVAAGLTIDAIRYYERLGLLPDVPRTRGGFRAYGPSAVERLRAIREAQGLGFSLKEIRDVVNPGTGPGREHCEDVRRMLERRLRYISERIEELEQLRLGVLDAIDGCTEALSRQGPVACPIAGRPAREAAR
jgi:MerR family mercuric resistance operon transcriptional regulator